MESGTSKLMNFALLITITIVILLQLLFYGEVSQLEQTVISQAEIIENQQLTCPVPEVNIDAPQNTTTEIIEEDRFTQHTQEYVDFINNVGPLLREYPEMIQFITILEISNGADLMILPSDKFGSLVPLPDN